MNKIETKLITTCSKKSGTWSFVNPPVYRGSTVLFDNYNSMASGETPYIYGRWSTPTSDAFCNAMTQLESAAGTILTCSGLAAISTTLLALAFPGSHILISQSSYIGALRLCEKMLLGLGVHVEIFSLEEAVEIHQKIRVNTALIYLDLPGYHGIDVINLEVLRQQTGTIPIVVDNTWATPFYCNPIQFGADIVIHSTSKYIAGHSDSIMGCIVFKNLDMYLKVRETSRILGQFAGADDINLALRGLKTLSVRIKQHYKSALQVATWLAAQYEVEAVFYAPLETDANHAAWSKQFRGGGGVLGFILQLELEPKASTLLNNLKIINLGWGWGGYESLASFSTCNYGKYSERIIFKLSIGLEASEDIISDLQSSFKEAYR